MSTTAQQKLEALAFWRKHGLDATRDAFSVSRSTLYAWCAKHRAGGLPALQDRSRVPRRPRRPASGAGEWWAMLGSNQRLLPCEGSALPLS